MRFRPKAPTSRAALSDLTRITRCVIVPPVMQRLITRHTNRKLYDPTSKRYVSLSDIAALVVAGHSVKVVEHPNAEDATPRILALALVDLIKRRAQSLPAGLMETLVRLAGGARSLPRTAVQEPLKGLAQRARLEAETIATRLVTRGRLGIEEALHLRKEVEDAIHAGVLAAETAARNPLPSLRPGRAVRTIAGLARELKSLESMVASPATMTMTITKARPPKPARRPRSTRSIPSSPKSRS